MKINHGLIARLRSALAPKTARAFRNADTDSIAETIHRALAKAGLETTSAPKQPVSGARSRRMPDAAPRAGPFADPGASWTGPTQNAQDGGNIDARRADARGRGEFLSRSFSNAAGTRTYKLYIPSGYSSAAASRVPLVVMLHGCSQSPDDFAAGTRMNALAEQHGFLVAYPAQAPNANGSKCWNWFRGQDQGRDRGEPALIAGITREIAASYPIDERRIFVAGLSAGAAMSVILGAVYPELYAAVGAHSGLPHGAAHDVPSAFAAMKGGQATVRRSRADIAAPGSQPMIPTIVFHGDADQTVVARNGDAIVEQAGAAVPGESRLSASVNQGGTADGRTYTCTVYADDSGHPVVEHWLLHGAGHAWSGGSSEGTFTDAGGPDASAEMIRFFYARRSASSTTGEGDRSGVAN